jgi:salicylate hydroxylase
LYTLFTQSYYGTRTKLIHVWRRYEHLDNQMKNFQDAKAKNPGQTFEESLEVKIKGFGGGDLSWIYQNDIQTVWEEFLKAEKSA